MSMTLVAASAPALPAGQAPPTAPALVAGHARAPALPAGHAPATAPALGVGHARAPALSAGHAPVSEPAPPPGRVSSPAPALSAGHEPFRALGARVFEPLSSDECWAVLGAGGPGRLAVIAPDGAPDVFPMNVIVHDGCLYLRTGAGSKLVDTARDPHVAFECDSVSPTWASSVVVRGIARRLDCDDEIESCGVLGLITLTPVSKGSFLCITPTAATGRRYRVTDCEE